MIDVVVTNGRCFIWNAEDASKLRQQHHIVGSLVGCLPRAPRQNRQLGLPLQLLPEEATLLRDKGIGRLVEYNWGDNSPSREDVERFKNIREELYWQQNHLFKEDRHQKIVQMADTIVEGKLKKLKSLSVDSASHDASFAAGTNVVANRDTILLAEHHKVEQTVMPRGSAMVQLFTGCARYSLQNAKPAFWDFPQTEQDKLKYSVFKDLWERGYYLTTGAKFGGVFLVYPGDPLKYHAVYIAICIPPNMVFCGHNIIGKGRMGTIVKKTVLLCSFKELNSETVAYLSLKWTGIS